MMRTWLQGICIVLCCAVAKFASGENHGSGNVERGKIAIERRGCVACHAISGISDFDSNVGPPLDDIAKRVYLAGILANTPQNMQRWLRNPPAVKPGTAMPDMGIGEAEAKDIMAYLYTLD
jgi:cytochrome c